MNTNIIHQFFGRYFYAALLVAFLGHIAAFFLQGGVGEYLLLMLVVLFVGILSYKSLPHGIAAAFFEIFIGGHGHLLHIDLFGFTLSLRMLIWCAVLSAWFILILQRKVEVSRRPFLELPFVMLSIALFTAFLQGYWQYGFSPAFDDANGYLTIAYLLPILSVKWTREQTRLMLQSIFAGAVWVSIFSLVLYYLFTHLDGDLLHILYTFVRDSRLAEVTLLVTDVFHLEYLYRIFMPGQSTVVLAFILLWAAMLFYPKQRQLSWYIYGLASLFLSVLFLSMSRSFLLGTAVSTLIVWALAFWKKRSARSMLKRTALSVFAGMIAIVVLWCVAAVPIPQRPDLSEASFYETSANTGRSEAVVSRWALLDPLMEAIRTQPIGGSGLGASITYTSSDPRIIAETGGVYTTYRFEWGWHDIWLKLGLFGLIAYIVFLAIVIYATYAHLKKEKQMWLAVAGAAAIFGLFVTHIFSPYLNHPIGISWMLLIAVFFQSDLWGLSLQKRFTDIAFRPQTAGFISSSLQKK